LPFFHINIIGTPVLLTKKKQHMKYATVDHIIASPPHLILPAVQGETDYQTVHAIRKLLQANARAIYTHLGGDLGHLGIIVSIAAYTIVAPLHPWENTATPGREPAVIEGGMAAQLIAARHLWKENMQTFSTYNTVQQALKKQIITVLNLCIWKS
jgi:hypothetical protein